MALINTIIEAGNFERVRTRIVQILTTELANQIVLVDEALETETNEARIRELKEIKACIPTKVWEERFKKPIDNMMPYLNVLLINAPNDMLTTTTTQIGETLYTIESWQEAYDEDEEGGDQLAAKQLHRLLSICRKILMDPNYRDLLFNDEPIIGYRKCEDVVIAQPDGGSENARNGIYGKIDCIVKLHETVPTYEGVELLGNDTNLKINKSEQGYFWTYNIEN